MDDAILVVDDSLTVRMDLSEAFEAAGFAVIPCATLAAARATLAQARVGLVVLDVILPDGDGLQFLHEIRSTMADDVLPVLVLSAEAEISDRIRGLRTGATEYVGKPYDTGYVVARARELLLARSEAPAAPQILVIDDSLTFRHTLGQELERAGYRVLAAADGDEGLRLAAALRPAAILVDGVMPGMDGATVIRRVRLDAALRSLPCVLLTASEESSSELLALDAGADAFVRKEESLDVILARLAAVLRGSSAGAGSPTASLLSPKRILAVDDSLTYLHELGDVLRGEGYDIVLASSGEQALEMLAVQPVDCILMDLLMPGIGGREACRRIKSSSVVRDVPLIILTAIEDRESMIDGLSLGADDFIQKSAEFEILKARVRAQMRRKQFEDEHRQVREQLLRAELEATEARAAKELAATRSVYAEELERKNQELEAFSYSISHDLRAPLRAIDGFSLALLEDYGALLDETGQGFLNHIRSSAQRMGAMINDQLELSRISRSELLREPLDLSALAREILQELHSTQPERAVVLEVEDGLQAFADPRLVRLMLENLLGNAWKFTSKTAGARIGFQAAEVEGSKGLVIRDNGAGFDMAYAQKLFRPFQRLHGESEFPGTGIGLSIVQRVVERHRGRIRAEAEIGQGARFFFTIPDA